MVAASPLPTEIRRHAESQTLEVVWSDGHRAEYAYGYVRGYCPCAGCQGHTPSEIRYQPPAGPVEPWRIEPVGNYGISIQWSDGHATGIYRFDFLRKICPCPECGSVSGEEAAAVGQGAQQQGDE